MAHADRSATVDVIDQALAKAHNYDFFRLLELLPRFDGDDDLESPDSYDAQQGRVRLSVSPSLSFPVSDVTLARRQVGQSHAYHVQTTFFGLHGTDSPLPDYYLDQLAYEYGQETGIRTAFLDVLHHRLLMLLHQIWRKYRYYIRFQGGARDRFSSYMFALIGLGDADIRGATPLPWSRLLSFAGLVALRSRSASIVEGIVAHCFNLETVQIREFEVRYDTLHPLDLVSVGRQNGQLGQSFVVGERKRSCHNKFTIVIPNLTRERFYAFLPNGEDFSRLRTLIDFLLRDRIAFDLDLGLREDQVPPFNLRPDSGTQLGWTSFLNQENLRPIRIKVRE